MNVCGRLTALEKELIIKLFAPLQWAGAGQGPRADPTPHPPRWYVAHTGSPQEARTAAPNNKAFYFGNCQDGKLVRLIRKISLA